ncbi:hypothetical protein KI387_042690, partial [Taxus chinensis]
MEESTVYGQEFIVECVETNKNRFLAALDNGTARIRRVTDFEDVCSFSFDEAADNNSTSSSGSTNNRKEYGSLNMWQAFICIDGVVHAWDANSGVRLHRLDGQMGEVFDMVADDEHVACCAVDTGIHLW